MPPAGSKFKCASCNQPFAASELVSYHGEIYCRKCMASADQQNKIAVRRWIIVGSSIVVVLIAILAAWHFLPHKLAAPSLTELIPLSIDEPSHPELAPNSAPPVAIAPTPPSPAPTPPAPAPSASAGPIIISGRAWIVNENGSKSIVQPTLTLLTNELPGSAVTRQLDWNAESARSNAKVERSWAGGPPRSPYRIAAPENPELAAKRAADSNKKAGDLEQFASVIEQKRAQVPPTMDMQAAYVFMQEIENLNPSSLNEKSRPAAWIQTMGELFYQRTVRETTADKDGKFSLGPIAPGKYYLYALGSAGAAQFEWLVPIDASGGPIALDLSNENATGLFGLESTYRLTPNLLRSSPAEQAKP